MSAIFGSINNRGIKLSTRVNEKFKEVLAHRSEQGVFVWEEYDVILGLCKSEIYNRNQNGQSIIENEKFVLVADARIDNRETLAKKLGFERQWLVETNDAGVIATAYLKWGPACLTHLDGAYAFAVWNKESRELLVATDAIGFKPLYYHEGIESFTFCSEVKGVKTMMNPNIGFDESQLSEYLYRSGDPAATYLKGVSMLCGGHSAMLKNGKVHLSRYWTLGNHTRYHFKKDSDWIDCLKDLLFKAVDKSLMDTDARIGISLSGGLDSSAIACILSERLAIMNKPLYAFSSVLAQGHQGPRKDERDYIEMVNAHCPNIIQTYVEAPGKGPFQDIKAAFEKHETFPNPFFYMDQAITEEVKANGVKLFFSGYGGDYGVSKKGNRVIYELFCVGALKTVINIVARMSRQEQVSWMRIFKREVISRSPLVTGILRSQKQINTNLLLEPYHPQTDSRFRREYSERKQLQVELEQGRIGKLVSRLDNIYAYDGISFATPMFDKNIMEFLMDMPKSLYVQNGLKRNAIRQAMSGIVPSEILCRMDKAAYTPDYSERIFADFPLLEDLIDLETNQYLFDNYIDKSCIKNWKETRDGKGNINGENSLIDIRIAQIGIICFTLEVLKENKTC